MIAQASFQPAPGGVTAAGGFRAGGLHCGIKAAGALDLGLVLSERPASVAGVFTRNHVAAAPVLLDRERCAAGRARAVIANSGNANACTGARGLEDARTMARLVAGRFDLPEEEVLVLSTGVIGVPLPMERVAGGIARLAVDTQGGEVFARAIMTTDTRPKIAAVHCPIGGVTVRLGGVAKGAGMIHPNMATLLAVVTTDAAVEPAYLRAALGRAADRSFNMISVDGDTSTNDSLLVLANGAAGGPLIGVGQPEAAIFEEALTAVCVALAREVARDGEGATSLIEVRVQGAHDEQGARAIARSITASSLVKTAVFGGDPNWGRILCAAGYAGPEVDPDRAVLFLEDVCLFREGVPQPIDRGQVGALLKQPEVHFRLELNLGHGAATAWGCDLSYEYVRINAEYTT